MTSLRKRSTRPWPATRPLVIEALEPRQLLATVGVSAGSVVSTLGANMLGTNFATWQWELSTSQMQTMITNSGMSLFRMAGGSASNSFHFNNSPPYNGYDTAPIIAKVVANVGGDGMVTVDYGEGSPQEAAAWLAYLNASTTDTTVIGNGLQWSSASKSWVTKNWQTAGYWASLRAAAPLGTDDGLNFLRINHPAPFNFTYFEVGNEDFATWETDMHNINNGTATASSAVSGTTASNAFNDDFSATDTSKWVATWTSGNTWVQYQFGNNESRVVRAYSIISSADISSNPTQAPKNWQFLGSNDGSTWAVLDTRSNQQDTTNADRRIYYTSNTTAYKYYRLNITATNGSTTNVQLADFRLEAADPDTYTTFAATFATLAHQIDPTAKIGIDTTPPAEWNLPDQNWTADCLSMGNSKGFIPDFLSDHSYFTGMTDSNLLLHSVNDPTYMGYQNVPANWAGKAAWYRTQISNTIGSAAPIFSLWRPNSTVIWATSSRPASLAVCGPLMPSLA